MGDNGGIRLDLRRTLPRIGFHAARSVRRGGVGLEGNPGGTVTLVIPLGATFGNPDLVVATGTRTGEALARER
jgi:hypothetical protein